MRASPNQNPPTTHLNPPTNVTLAPNTAPEPTKETLHTPSAPPQHAPPSPPPSLAPPQSPSARAALSAPLWHYRISRAALSAPPYHRRRDESYFAPLRHLDEFTRELHRDSAVGRAAQEGLLIYAMNGKRRSRRKSIAK